MVKILHNYIHEFDFFSSAFLRRDKEELVRFYEDNRGKGDGSNDIELTNTPLSHFFNLKVKNLIKENYIIDHSKEDIAFNLYIQNKDISENIFHNHIHRNFSICGVMYLDVPQEGGEIEFLHYPENGENNPIKIKPQEDKIYFFPPWLYHRPLPHISLTTRICINLGYRSNLRPILKKYNLMW